MTARTSGNKTNKRTIENAQPSKGSITKQTKRSSEWDAEDNITNSDTADNFQSAVNFFHGTANYIGVEEGNRQNRALCKTRENSDTHTHTQTNIIESRHVPLTTRLRNVYLFSIGKKKTRYGMTLYHIKTNANSLTYLHI